MEKQANNSIPSQVFILGASKYNNLLVQVGSEVKEVSNDPESLKQLLVDAGQTSFEVANKTYNIGQIAEANFQLLIQELPFVVPKNLTPPPFRAEVFLGREQELQTIKEHFFAGDGLFLLINGTGGVGKTTLAAQYYLKFHQEYAHSAWLLCEPSIASVLLRLAAPLGIEFENTLPEEKRVETILQTIAEQPAPILFVLDNANDLLDLEANDLNLRRLPNAHVLLTSRITKFGQAKTYSIGGLPLEKAKTLFKRYYPNHQESEDTLFEQIYHAVEGNTLVIELLAKNLECFNPIKIKINYSLASLLHDLQTRGLLAINSREVRYALQKAKPEDIISAMYDLGELEPAEKRLLSNFAVLPAEAIPFVHLERLLPSTTDLDQLLVGLAQQGWLDYNEEDSSFKMSPVVQEIVREKSNSLLPDTIEMIKVLIQVLRYDAEKYSYNEIPNINASTAEKYAERILSRFYPLEEETEPIETRFLDDESSFTEHNFRFLAELGGLLGGFHERKGNLEKAYHFCQVYEKFILQLYNYFQDDYIDHFLALAKEKKGLIQLALGDINRAFLSFKRFNELEEQLTKDYPDVDMFKKALASSYRHLGDIKFQQPDFAEALHFFEQNYNILDSLFKEKPDDTTLKKSLGISFERLMQVFAKMGEHSAQRSFLEKYHELFKRLYQDKPENPGFKHDYAIVNERLGALFKMNKEYDKALECIELYHDLSWELCQDYPDHVEFKNSVSIALEKLGRLHQDWGNYDQALKVFTQGKERLFQYCEDYPNYFNFRFLLAISHEKLGEVYCTLKLFQNSIEHFEKAIQMFNEFCENDEYPDKLKFVNELVVAYEQLAITYCRLSDLPQALKFFELSFNTNAQLHSAYPDNFAYKNQLKRVSGYLGWTHFLLHDLVSANQFTERELELFQQLSEDYPDDNKFQSEYARALATSAAINILLGKDYLVALTTAREHYNKLYLQTQLDAFVIKETLLNQMLIPGADIRSLIIKLNEA